MQIIFGLEADGMNPHKKEDRLGIKTVGPNGFLMILEAQLGLPVKKVSHTSRVVSYLKRIESAGIQGRFFENSFKVDKFNVAAELLAWRDQWFLGGWNGAMSSNIEKRLSDVADIEKEVHVPLSPGEGERLRNVISALDNQTTQIIELQLIDPIAHFPKAWCQVIQLFSWFQIDDLSPCAEPGTDLSIVQNTLLQLREGRLELGQNGDVIKARLKGDGTFQVVRSGSKAVSALSIADAIKSDVSNTAILSGSDGIEIDEAFELNNLPRLGFKRHSSARPALQLLPLAIDLLWEPLNPESLLEFLLLPYAPIQKGIRSKLASVIAESPGMDGTLWKKAVNELLINIDKLSKKKLLQDIETWVNPMRFVSTQGIPVDVLQQRALKVSQWVAQRLALDEDELQRALYQAASNQANELAVVLSQFEDGKMLLSLEQIHYLIEQVTGSGTDLIDRFAECSPGESFDVVSTTTPSTFMSHFETVVWWDIQGAGIPISPFSNSEMNCLNDNGIDLILPESLYKMEAGNSLKPILSVTKQLFLYIHESAENQHPLIDQLICSVEGWEEIVLDEALFSESVLSKHIRSYSIINPKSLPALRRWWNVDASEDLGKRPKESFSSLELMFKSPYQWILNYKARLRSSPLSEISDGNILKGNLIHHLYELFFQQNAHVLLDATLNTEEVHQWFDMAFVKLLHEEGLVLLQPGRAIEMAGFEEIARNSLLEFIKQLRAAKVIEIEMEGYNEGHFFGGTLSGYIDARVVNEEGVEAIVDIKWAGKKFREDSLRENEHLQLVTYSFLRGQNLKSQGWPSVAYFIIVDAVMLSQSNEYFPLAVVVNNHAEENIKQVWHRMQYTWNWRQRQLKQGLIEVTVGNTEPDDSSQPGEDGLELADSSDYFNDYAVLTGWRKT